MKSGNVLILRLRLTGRNALFLLTAFFLCWHPGFLGSETITLTTYYPAPYGGYASLLTTGQTLLSRDGGVAASYVRIGSGYNGAGGRRSATIKLEVGDGGISTSDAVQWGTARGGLYADQGGSIELGGTGGTPYIDFTQDMVQDYSARLMLSQAGRLQVVGDFEVTGTIWGLCGRAAYAGGVAAVSCPAGYYPVSLQGNGASPHWSGFLPSYQPSNQTENDIGTYVFIGEDWVGERVCCKFN